MTHAAILYYFPGKAAGGFTAAALAAIPERLRGRFVTHTRQDSSPGPDGGRGLLITWQENVLVNFDAKAQNWQRSGDHWRGVRKDYQAAEFARDAPTVTGYPTRLGDGRTWVIPVALAIAPNYTIPWREGLDDEGRLVRAVDPAYADVCRLAQSVWSSLDTSGRLQIDDNELQSACALTLRVNYQINLDECCLLNLFSSAACVAILRALIDAPGIEAQLRDSVRQDEPSKAAVVPPEVPGYPATPRSCTPPPPPGS